MKAVCFIVLKFVLSFFRKRMSIQMENAALRHQLKAYKRKDRKPKIKPTDRMLWSLLSQIWSGWKDALYFVKPATVVSWRRKSSGNIGQSYAETVRLGIHQSIAK